jgi:hypothetical protein
MANDGGGVTPTEAMRQALAELGDAPNAELAAFLERRFGLRIDARFVPVLKASARGLEQLERARRAAKEAVARAAAKPEDKAEGG